VKKTRAVRSATDGSSASFSRLFWASEDKPVQDRHPRPRNSSPRASPVRRRLGHSSLCPAPSSSHAPLSLAGARVPRLLLLRRGRPRQAPRPRPCRAPPRGGLRRAPRPRPTSSSPSSNHMELLPIQISVELNFLPCQSLPPWFPFSAPPAPAVAPPPSDSPLPLNPP
jgi:hypothetical protein